MFTVVKVKKEETEGTAFPTFLSL